MMAKPVPVRVPEPRIIHYVDPAQPANLQVFTVQELVERRAQDRVLYARWVARQAAIAERDRKTRKVMLGVAAGAGTVLLAGTGLLAWLAYQAILSAGAALLLVPLILLGLAGAAFGGHRCVTIVQHWH